MKKYIYLFSLLIVIFSSCDVNGDPEGDAFLEASKSENLEEVKALLDKGVDVNYTNPTFHSTTQTAAIKAARKGHIDILKLLVEKGADWHKGTSGGRNPITFAAENGHFDIVYYLIELGEDVNYQDQRYGMNAILHASTRGNLTAIARLLELGANPDSRNLTGQNSIICAAENQHYDVVYYMANLGGDLNYQDNNEMNAILYASEQGKLETVKKLLGLGAKADVRNSAGEDPMDLAAKKHQVKLYKFWLQDQKKTATKAQLFAVVNAAYVPNRRQQQIVQAILSAGVNINVQNNEQDTLLHIAYKYKNKELIDFLTQKGAEEAIKNIRGLTPKEVEGELIKETEAEKEELG